MALKEQELREILDHSMHDITGRFGGIELRDRDTHLSNDICTVHTVLEGGQRAVLLLCADTALLTRLARNVVRKEAVTTRDIEDAATEYFNVLCGRVAAGLFQSGRISSRFRPPRFHTGCYHPTEQSCSRCVLHYTGERDEGVKLVYMGLDASDKKE